MKANESGLDRIIRAMLGLFLLGLGVFVVKGTVGVVLDVVGAIMLFTAATGFCLLYKLLGSSGTIKKA